MDKVVCEVIGCVASSNATSARAPGAIDRETVDAE